MTIDWRRHALTSIFIGITLILCGQEVFRVNSSWINTEVALDWNKEVEFELTQSTRFDDVLNSFSVSNTTIKVAYQITDWLKIQPGYRYSFREFKQRKFNRFQLGLQARKKIGDFKLTWRTRLEQKNAIGRDKKETRLRNKFTTAYPIKKLKLEPKVFIEYWYSNDPEIKNFSKYRIGVACEFEIYKRGTIKFGYSYDNDLNQPEIEKENILILGYTHKFKRKKVTKSDQ